MPPSPHPVDTVYGENWESVDSTEAHVRYGQVNDQHVGRGPQMLGSEEK